MRVLEKYGIDIYDRIEVLWRGLKLEGILLPRPLYGDPNVLILKLDNGYNIGVDIGQIQSLRLVEKRPETKRPPTKIKFAKEYPKVSLLGTGGTIASRVDYRTGAVYPSFKIEDLYDFLPEIFDLALLDAEEMLKIFSEDMTPRLWSRIAERIASKYHSGYRGIVIAHGTDTMSYTAAALSFALRNIPGPVVLVGAQRSSDRPSSDTALNLLGAVATAAYAPFGEVVVAMHGETGDSFVLLHRGTKVRKMHTSRRDAFRSINDFPLAVFMNRKIYILSDDYFPCRSIEDLKVRNQFDEKVALIKFYPGMDPQIIDFLIDKGYHGIVIEATGLGHVREELLPSIRRGVEEGIAIVISSQCLWGRVNLNVYRRGVELLKAGVIPAEDMLPETAFVKLCWTLAQTRDLKEVRKIMLTNIAHEINYRHVPEHYPPVFDLKMLNKYTRKVVSID
ncbi:MAG: Glu-tRNA(Gln) amidotransferase GatDE subunit D [Thermoprotei archaeon]|nr:MAG: Glu-tRNA(Gln) amidotransferase GatDE subunit D [Thermoprotei archaeon]RLF02678.1 MAG: Glu-tRNA(Gln) amidotransferase GatDE subunit D [Thermoprotei archaeon]